jgi:hypothetical protein
MAVVAVFLNLFPATDAVTTETDESISGNSERPALAFAAGVILVIVPQPGKITYFEILTIIRCNCNNFRISLLCHIKGLREVVSLVFVNSASMPLRINNDD